MSRNLTNAPQTCYNKEERGVKHIETNYHKIEIIRTCDSIHLHFIGDTHKGLVNHDEKKFDSLIANIEKDPQAYWFFMGDMCDNRRPDHKFYDPETSDFKLTKKEHNNNFIYSCYKEMKKRLIRIKSKCLGIHEGNHDLGNKYGHPYVLDMCELLKVPYLGYRALSVVTISHPTCTASSQTYKIFTTHGSGGGRKTGAKINRIEDEAMSTDADIYAQGHTHLLSIHEGIKHAASRVVDGAFKIIERPQIFINTGSFLKSYVEGSPNYSEKFSFKPQPTGSAMLKIEARKNKITGYTLK